MDWKTAYLYPAVRPLVTLAVQAASRARLPQTQGSLRVSGLGGAVEVLRDRWSVAHIFAQNAADALFAQGYVHAQERLWQMEVTRRVIAGRMAQIVGPAGLDADRAMLTVGFRRLVEREAAALPEPISSLIAAYCAGASAWIETAARSGKLPVEFMLLGFQPAPWQPPDVLGWAKLMSWTLAANWESEFLRGQLTQRLGPQATAGLELAHSDAWAAVLDASLGGQPGSFDATAPFTGSRGPDAVGSNNWVLDGSRTTTGMPLLANDMHLDLSAPAIWYENHLACPDFEISGLSLPGCPFIITGHNRHVAWGYTDGFADVQDLYEEHLRPTPSGGVEYEYQGQWLPAEVRQEEIPVKGQGVVRHTVTVTRHGPIINLLFEKAYPAAPPMALRWTALDPETTFHAIYQMNTARSCAEFHQALRLFSGPAQNVVYADTQGSIGYTLNGRVPVRAKGDGSLPVPGWTGEYEWLGDIPFEAMPHLENPPRGLIVTANNVHARGESEWLIGRDYCTADRAARITELIEARPKIDLAYIQKMHLDQVSISARELARYLGGLSPDDPLLRQITALMRDWDGSLAAGSPLAGIYQATMRQALRLVLSHHAGDLSIHVQGKGPASGLWSEHSWEWFVALLPHADSPWFNLGGGERRDDVLLRALTLAVEALQQQFGRDWTTWTWGRLHELTFHHLLGEQPLLANAFNLGPFPIGGDGTTIFASGANKHDFGHAHIVGPAFRFIADLSDLDHCWGALAPGQSGHPGSPAYSDGIGGWLAGQYHPILILREEIEQNLQAHLVLEPALGTFHS